MSRALRHPGLIVGTLLAAVATGVCAGQLTGEYVTALPDQASQSVPALAKQPAVPAKTTSHTGSAGIWHGFMNVGVMHHPADAVIVASGYRGAQARWLVNPLMWAGAQWYRALDSQWSVEAQATFRQVESEHNTFRASADWFFLNYQVNPHGQLGVGRFRLPLLLFQQTAEIGVSYPWPSLPAQVYALPLLSTIDGIHVSGQWAPTGSPWQVLVHAFLGAYQRVDQPWLDRVNLYSANHPLSFKQTLAALLAIKGPGFRLQGGFGRWARASSSVLYTYTAGLQSQWRMWSFLAEWIRQQRSTDRSWLVGRYAALGIRLGHYQPMVTYAQLRSQRGIAMAEDAIGLSTQYQWSKRVTGKVGLERVKPLRGTVGLQASSTRSYTRFTAAVSTLL